jgi:hypothetical protein
MQLVSEQSRLPLTKSQKLRRKAIDDGKKYAKQRGTVAFRAKLRARFLERIRHYIGTSREGIKMKICRCAFGGQVGATLK